MMNDDHILMERIRTGDEEAFAILVARSQDVLLRHLSGMVRDGDAAADLCQEVFLRMWTRAEQWDGRGGVKAWLFRIGTNLALNHLRTVRRRREMPLEPASIEDDDPHIPAWMIDGAAQGPETAFEHAEHVRRLRRLVDDLPEDKRDVWNLVYGAEMDMQGAAEALGIPEGTVKSRLYHARKRLAREWTEIAREWESME